MNADDIVARVAAMWHLEGALPMPRVWWVRCPVCRSAAFMVREWRVFARADTEAQVQVHRLTHRCDVSLKCLDCSAVWAHGLAISATTARHFGWAGGVRVVHWRDAPSDLPGSRPEPG